MINTLESTLHQRYADKRVNGSEFFRLTTQDILDIVTDAGGTAIAESERTE